MKKYLSVFGLALQGSMGPIISLLGLSAALQVGIFVISLKTGYVSSTGDAYRLCGIVFGLCFCLLTALLCRNGCNIKNARPSYTFMRLQISDKSVFVLWAVHNALWLLIFWAMEAALLFGLSEYAGKHLGGQMGMAAFTQFYTQPFLHSVIPLEEVLRTIRNAVFVITLGATSAQFSQMQRMGRKGMAAPVTVALILVYFVRPMGTVAGDIAASLFAVIIAATGVFNCFSEAMNETE